MKADQDSCCRRARKIAGKAGIFYSTVSRDLNDKKGVRTDLREWIKKMPTKSVNSLILPPKALVQNRVCVIGLIW